MLSLIRHIFSNKYSNDLFCIIIIFCSMLSSKYAFPPLSCHPYFRTRSTRILSPIILEKQKRNNLPANANCLIKKSIRVLRRLPHWRPIRTAILPTTIIANSSHKTVNCSVCNRKKKKMEHNRDDSQVYRINLATWLLGITRKLFAVWKNISFINITRCKKNN